MENKKGLAVAGGIGLALLLFKYAKATPDDAGLTLVIYDSDGNPVPHNSPAELAEGDSYTVVVTITNRSTYNQQPFPAQLAVETICQYYIVTQYDVLYTLWEGVWDEIFQGGETKEFSIPFTVPVGHLGSAGDGVAFVDDPDGVELGRVTENIRIVTRESLIVYNASIRLEISEGGVILPQPYELAENASYRAEFIVDNLSTYRGNPYEATLDVWGNLFYLAPGYVSYEIFERAWPSWYFSAGASNSFAVNFTVPGNTAGISTTISGAVLHPTQNLDSLTIPVTFVLNPGLIDYGADIDFGV